MDLIVVENNENNTNSNNMDEKIPLVHNKRSWYNRSITMLFLLLCFHPHRLNEDEIV